MIELSVKRAAHVADALEVSRREAFLLAGKDRDWLLVGENRRDEAPAQHAQLLRRRCLSFENSIDRLERGADAATADFGQDFAFGREMRVDEGLGDTEPLGHSLQRRMFVAALVEKLDRCLDDPFTLECGDFVLE